MSTVKSCTSIEILATAELPAVQSPARLSTVGLVRHSVGSPISHGMLLAAPSQPPPAVTMSAKKALCHNARQADETRSGCWAWIPHSYSSTYVSFRSESLSSFTSWHGADTDMKYRELIWARWNLTDVSETLISAPIDQ